jgi:hypothetical protein
MKGLRLFKTQTSVLGVFLLLILWAPVSAVRAEDEAKVNCPAADAKQMGVEQVQQAFPGAGINSYDSYLKFLGTLDSTNQSTARAAYNQGVALCKGVDPASVGTNNDKSCQEAGKEFRKALGEFSSSCAKAGLGSDASQCVEKVQECNTASALHYASGTTSTSDPITSFNNAVQGQSMQATTRRSVTPTGESASERFDACPVYAAEDLENWQKTIDDSQKRVDDLNQRISDLEADVTDTQTEMAQKLKEIKDQSIEAQQNAEDEAENIRLELQEFEENLANQVSKLEDAITNQNNIIDKLGSAKVEAYNAFANAQTTLNLQCHASALTKVAQIQQAKQSLISQSRYSAGGFNNLLKSVGLSNEQAAEKLAKKYYDSCLADRAYRENLKIAERGYNLAVTNADKAISSARKTIAKLQEQIARVQGELKMKGLENFARRLDKLNSRLVTKQQQLQEDYVLQGQRYASQIANKQKQLQQAQADLATAKDFLTQRQAYYDLKNQYSGGRNLSQEDVSTLFSNYSNMSEEAWNVNASCSGGSETSQQICSAAIPFLPSSGETDSFYRACSGSSGGVSPTSVPASAGPGGDPSQAM